MNFWIFALFALLHAPLWESSLIAGNLFLVKGIGTSAYYNPALIEDSTVISFFYTKPFSLENLHYSEFSISGNHICFSFAGLLYPIYNEYNALLAFSHGHDNFRFGTGVKFVYTKIENLGQYGLTFILGNYLQINSKTYVAFSLLNFLRYGNIFEHSPWLIIFSLFVKANPSLYFDVSSSKNFGIEPRISIVYKLTKRFSVGMGQDFSSNQTSLYLKISTFPILDYSIRYHEYLGLTHAFGIIWKESQ